jgi:hypothetical protein
MPDFFGRKTLVGRVDRIALSPHGSRHWKLIVRALGKAEQKVLMLAAILVLKKPQLFFGFPRHLQPRENSVSEKDKSGRQADGQADQCFTG